MKELQISVRIPIPDAIFEQATKLAAIEPAIKTFLETVADSPDVKVEHKVATIRGPRAGIGAKPGRKRKPEVLSQAA